MVSLSIIVDFWEDYFRMLQRLDLETIMRWGWFILLLDIPRYVIVEGLALIWSRSRRIITRKKWKQARQMLWTEYPLVTVLVPGHNEGRHLSKLVASMKKQTYQHIELVVVDDGSTDNTAIIGQSFEKKGDIDIFLRCGERGGKASAANLGLRYAKGKFIVHLDADSSLAPDALEKILIPFYRYPHVGAVGGNLVVRNESDSLTTTMQYMEYIQSISVGRIVLSKLGLYKIVSGAFGAFPRKLLDRMGGWDIGPGLDGDITVKIRKLGYKVLFEENAVCLTHVPTTWKALTKQRRRWSRSLVRFRLRKHIDVWVPDKHFSWLNFVAFFENVFFGFVLDFMWIFYTLKILIVAPGFLLVWFPFKYTLYLGIAIFQYICSFFVINDRSKMLKMCIYIPLVPLYMGYYMRLVRTVAYIGEMFFYESYKDVWNPAKTSKKAKEFGMEIIINNYKFYMFSTNTKISALAVSLALLASCTKNTYQTEAGHGDVLSDAETSLSYDKNALAANVSVENSPIVFDRLGSTSLLGLVKLTKLASLTGQQAVAGYTPSATGEEIEGGGNYTISNSSDVLVVPAGKTFSGQINFNAAGKLIVLGTFTGSTSLPNKGTLEIGNEAVFTPSGFNVNGSAAVVNNYGTVVLNSGSIQGKWTNYAQVTFKSNTSLNSVMQFDNYCKVVFEGRVNINSQYKNWSYMVFQEGFQLNGQGQLQNHDGAYTEVNGGTIGIDGKIVGGTSAYSRLDISNTTINNLNANLAVTGKIDINFTNADETRFAGKTGADVTIGQDVYIAAAGCTPAKGSGGCDDSALSFTLLATVTSPEVNDALLSATDVRIADGHAYVSYHTNDEVYGNTPGGAIRIFDVQNPSALSLISEALFTNMEFNGVEANDTKLYAAGQNKAGALLLTAPLNNGNLAVNDLSQFTKHKLPAASAKNTVSYNNQLWVVSGAANGGFFALDPQNGYQVAQNLYTSTRAKYSANNATYQAFFAAESDKAYLRVAKLDGSDVKEYTFPALTQQIVDGKNVLVLDDLYAYIALSDRGVAKIDLATGELKAHFVPNDFRKDGKKVFRNNGYTNAVAVDGCYLYLANGADGVIVLNKNTFQVVGKFNLPESTNFVAAKSGLLFVATGRNGLNIIKIN